MGITAAARWRDNGGPAPVLSVIVPTKDEVENIRPLLARLANVAPEVAAEIIFVDDSSDGTAEEIERLGVDQARSVTVIHRPAGQRWGGLGGAVVDGLARSSGTWACVMDGDLQHPPELIEDLLEAAEDQPVDLVVASRYTAAGESGSFGVIRSALSKVTTTMARVSFARRLRGISDPMSGFFLVRRDAIDVNRLKPHGFKILLEILVRTPELRRTEVPFTFGKRFAGSSKASVAEARRYLVHLGKLRLEGAARFARFGTVGLTGLVVNMAVARAFHECRWHLLLAVRVPRHARIHPMELCSDRDLGVPRPGAQTQRSAAPGVVFHREQRGTRAARADSVRPDLGAGDALPLVELHLARCSDGRAVHPRRQLDLG